MADAIVPVDGSLPVDFPADTQPEISPTPTIPVDTVSFSVPAQVFLLAQQGAGVGEIASELGVTQEEVLIDLDITTTAIAPMDSSVSSMA